jgi:hypothetical protein
MNALEFADMIERYNAGVMSQKICEDYKDAADELRRLAAVEAELVALKKSLAAAQAEAEPRLFLTGEDDAWCAECGVKLEAVRPGKHQHPDECAAAIRAMRKMFGGGECDT